MSLYGSYVKFTTQPGQRDRFVELMLESASQVNDVAGCQLYIINTSVDEPDCVWVTEIWQSKADHDASLTLDSVRTQIQRVIPLLAKAPESILLEPVGGLGL